MSLRQIAEMLNSENVLTPMGRPWRKAYVDRFLHTKYTRELIELHISA
jgi:hypothetical protein